MKIKNQLVSVKIGKKEHSFTNLILDNYLNLFANSFIKFENKGLDFCLINFTKTNTITQASTSMQFDVVLTKNTALSAEYLNYSSIINKYYYNKEYVLSSQKLSDFEGQPIREIGFARYDEITSQYVLYAYLDVSNYDLVPQNSQPIVINRIDKIESDMSTYVNDNTLKGPYHLSQDGILEGTIARKVPELYSVGFGPMPDLMTKEYLVENLDITVQNSKILFNDDFLAYYNSNTLFARENLFANENLYAKKATENYLLYKFKMYRDESPLYEDTGLFYIQYKKITKQGTLNLNVSYERS